MKKRPGLPPLNVVEGDVPVDVIAEAIVKIGTAMKLLQGSRLNEKAIVILVAQSAGLSQSTVRTVLQSLYQLERTYLK